MSDTSRRKFLAAAGAGTAAGAVVSLSGGAAEAVTRRRHDAATEPVVAYVQDPKVGVLHLMVGEREVIVEDHDLVARILNAAGRPADMSSHREAPEISKDPVADSTDVYAFVSPDRPDTVTLIANYIPLQKPDGGPNFYEFGDDVRYEIHISNKGKADADIIYQFEFTHQDPQQGDVPLQHRPDHLASTTANWNRPQFYTVTRIEDGKTKVARPATCPARR